MLFNIFVFLGILVAISSISAFLFKRREEHEPTVVDLLKALPKDKWDAQRRNILRFEGALDRQRRITPILHRTYGSWQLWLYEGEPEQKHAQKMEELRLKL